MFVPENLNKKRKIWSHLPTLSSASLSSAGARMSGRLCHGRQLFLFFSAVGWCVCGGGMWKAVRSRSPLFLSSCVLTPSASFSPRRTTHWVSTRSETEARQDLLAQPRPRPGAGRGPPSPHHSQSKCHLLLTCKSVTIAPLGAAIRSSGGNEY